MARFELTRSKAQEYSKASKKRKGQILDGLCEDSGWSRDNARRQLKAALKRPPEKYRSKQLRKTRYSARSKRILVNLWVLSGCCCGKYLASQISAGLIERLISFKELKDGACNQGCLVIPGDLAIEEIAQMSPATIDRSLKDARRALQPLSQSSTKRSNSPLRNEIAFGRSWAGVSSPGYLSTDTVAHCGDSLKGEHLWTLNSTDVYSGWTETITIKNRARRWIIAGHEEILGAFPFKVIAINYDGGSEFINYQMLDYAKMHHYQMTRSRPYHSNDNAHIEQRNYSVVRKHAFRFRYEGKPAQDILNALWYWVGLRKNYLVPCRKCIGHTKTRSGRTRGIYDKPLTPYQRCLASGVLSDKSKERLAATFARLNDARITREINRLQHELLLHTSDSTVLELVQRAIDDAKVA